MVRGGTGVDPSIQCSNGQIVVSWDLGGVGGCPRGSWSRSVNTMFKWTNSGFVGPGGGWGVVRGGTGVDPSIQCSNGQIVVSWDLGGVGGGPRGYWGRSVNTMFKWTNSGFVGPGGGGGWSAGGTGVDPSIQCSNGQIVVSWDLGGWGVVRVGTGVDPSIQCSNGQIVVSWDLGGVGGGPRG